MSKIETDLVFLDTCIYVTHKFNFKSLLFLGFMDLCKQKHIKPITTNVHQIELENKMNEIVGVAVSAHKKFRNLGLPLRNLNNEALSKHLSRIDTLQLQVGFANLLSEFNNQTGTEIIETNAKCIPDVMSRYYKKSAPFGKGEKRKEFVDAFILEGLSKCTHTKGRKIYVVSTDTDMEKYCESDDNLMHLSNLQDLLKLFFAQYQPAESYVQALIDKSYPKVSSLIQNEFPTFQFDTKEYSGEVEDVSVKSVTVLHHFTIFSTPETIDVVYVVKVEYSATITYESYEFACWDSEDHEWVGIERGEVEIDETHEMDVEVQLEIDVNTHRLFQINLLNFPNNEVIVIKFNPDDYGG